MDRMKFIPGDDTHLVLYNSLFPWSDYPYLVLLDLASPTSPPTGVKIKQKILVTNVAPVNAYYVEVT